MGTKVYYLLKITIIFQKIFKKKLPIQKGISYSKLNKINH